MIHPARAWKQTAQLRPGTASPLVFRDRVYTLNDGGILTCGDAGTGARLWQLRLEGPFSATPIAAGRHLYLANEKGQVQIVDPAKPEGEVVGTLDLGEMILSTPSISGGAIYLRSDQHIWKVTRPGASQG